MEHAVHLLCSMHSSRLLYRRSLRRERLFRDRLNPLEQYDDVEVKNLFRFERANVLQLVDLLAPHIQHQTGRSLALSPLQQVCVSLRYYATGSMQLSIAAWMNVDKSTVSRVVWNVTQAILQAVEPLVMDVNPLKEGFYRKFGLPNTVGAIDCTHVKILAPPSALHPEEYINRKNVHSINVQAICDCDCKFIDLVAAWPGSVHDSRIFKTSEVYNKLLCGDMHGILLGDNGYGLQPFLIVPFLNPGSQDEEYYNYVHKKARCTIERTFGQLKKRFFCLASTMRIKLNRIPAVITACVYLHNMAKKLQDPDVSDVDTHDIVNDYLSDDHYFPPSLSDAPGIVASQNDNYVRRMGEAKRREIVTFLQLHRTSE